MLTTVFPDHLEVDPRLTPSCPLEHIEMTDWPNVFIYYRARKDLIESHVSPLSIKTIFRGREHYLFDGRRTTVAGQSFLILNHSRPYAYEISADQEVESLCTFFHAGFAAKVLASLTHPSDKLLDDPRLQTQQPTLFFEKLYPPDNLITPLLKEIRDCIRINLPCYGFYEEAFHMLLQRLLRVHRLACHEMEALNAVRLSTRIEIYKRLNLARDFIESSFQRTLTLQEISRAASLSSHHFLRLFKQLFSRTPHQYLMEKRLRVSAELLRHSDDPIIQICLSVGFENPSSFGRLFRRHYGQTPSAYRRSQRISQTIAVG